MSWVKDANKIGEYKTTYGGYRIYCIKQPQIVERIEERETGIYRITDFVRGEFLAINKDGDKIEGYYLEDIASKIDIQEIKKRYE